MKSQLQVLISELQPIASYPWANIERWARRAAPQIQQISPRHFPRFVELTEAPSWPNATAVFPGGTREEYNAFIQAMEDRRIALYKPMCEQRKTEIIAFLNSI